MVRGRAFAVLWAEVIERIRAALPECLGAAWLEATAQGYVPRETAGTGPFERALAALAAGAARCPLEASGRVELVLSQADVVMVVVAGPMRGVVLCLPAGADANFALAYANQSVGVAP